MEGFVVICQNTSPSMTAVKCLSSIGNPLYTTGLQASEEQDDHQDDEQDDYLDLEHDDDRDLEHINILD